MGSREKFILFGDSQIERAGLENEGYQFANELENALNGKYEVVVHGFPGANSYDALEYLKDVIPCPKEATVRFIAIWFGTNDADRLRKVSVEEYERNLVTIINSPQIRAHVPNISVILMTPGPIEESLLIEHKKNKYGWEGPPSFTAASAALYAEKVLRLVQELKTVAEKEIISETTSTQTDKREKPSLLQLEALNVWGEFMSKTGWHEGTLPGSSLLPRNKILSELLSDGVHLTPAGYKIVLSILHNLIKTKWVQLV